MIHAIVVLAAILVLVYGDAAILVLVYGDIAIRATIRACVRPFRYSPT